ncbi:GGDEF domain-containing protein [Sulfurimonas lithotrophica]|uniref:diguanylate cyclase n=1 Tax=Sulfurimonas lithotrophica TaxID=2590022 RepID=A0A5P8NZV5_9BACT|nr:GGDEF domain-containing protein [Sulfurimonas lithotrophica]QFR48973.1 GGDEF domain-containing protein [Sulfurimonas lithotrophica]
MNKKNVLRHPYYLSIIAIGTISFLMILLFLIIKYEKSIENDMFKISTSDVFQITKHKANYIKSILGESDSFIDDIKSDENLRINLERNIKNLLTTNIKYSYIVYKDENDVFRFLIDASPESEKSMLNQKFDVTSKKWFEIYTKKEPLLIKHHLLQKLYISYLVPIINKDNVELILVIDFSINKISEINNIITIMKIGIILIIVVILTALLLVVFQLIKYKTMRKSSFTDRLTNIYNRNYLHHIENNIKLDEYVLSVLDIDYFKKINDTYGHDIGDEVLQKIGSVLLHTLREDDDIAIRYGGEEFVILIKIKNENTKASISVIQRIFNRIKEHKFFVKDEEYIHITSSIGVNVSPGDYDNFAEAFKAADMALYEAKNSGRNNIKFSRKNT